jgi:hypothetical protein
MVKSHFVANFLTNRNNLVVHSIKVHAEEGNWCQNDKAVHVLKLQNNFKQQNQSWQTHGEKTFCCQFSDKSHAQREHLTAHLQAHQCVANRLLLTSNLISMWEFTQGKAIQLYIVRQIFCTEEQAGSPQAKKSCWSCWHKQLNRSICCQNKTTTMPYCKWKRLDLIISNHVNCSYICLDKHLEK